MERRKIPDRSDLADRLRARFEESVDSDNAAEAARLYQKLKEYGAEEQELQDKGAVVMTLMQRRFIRAGAGRPHV